VTFTWAVRLPAARAAALGALRLADGVRVLPAPGELWLGGDDCDDALGLKLAALPEALRFGVLPDGQLVRPGERVPSGNLPHGEWQALRQWLKVAAPVASLAGEPPPPTAIRLVRGGAAREPNVLVAAGQRWLDYATSAPRVRLQRWSFALDGSGGGLRVVVRGAPLPPIPGQALVEACGVAVPAGYTWDPPLDAEVLRDALQLAGGDLALLFADGTHERIAAEQFVQATRSAVRLSLAAEHIASGGAT
jgi:hypothetical protein